MFHNTPTHKVSLGNELKAACELIHLSKYGNARPKFVEEVNRILDAAKTVGVPLGLPGALAFRFHCPS